MSQPVSSRVLWEKGLEDLARMSEDIQRKADFYGTVTQLSTAFTICCGLGIIATESPAGKQRRLANKIFLGASLVGVAAVVCSLVATIALAYSNMRKT